MSSSQKAGEVKNILFRSIPIVLGLLIVSGLCQKASAAAELKLSDVLKEAVIKGDFRVRHETRYRPDHHNLATTSSDRIRHIQRFRLRLTMDFKLPHGLEVKTRLATGKGEQTSTNQSFDNLSSQKPVWWDLAYLYWKANERLQMAAGRMNNPFWLPYSGDVVWDGDFSPEGAYEKYQFSAPLRSRVFLNALQMVVDEDSTGMQDQAMFGQQVGAEFLVLDQSKLTVATALYEWVNERAGSFGSADGAVPAPTAQPGNRAGQEFRVHEVSGEFATEVVVPVRLQGTIVKNKKAQLQPDENTGFQYGAIIGKAGKAKKWEAAYFYKRVEADATVADIADSDFGVAGGTNRKGHIFWVSYSPLDFMQLTAKHFITKPIEATLAGAAAGALVPGNRTQFDVVVKF